MVGPQPAGKAGAVRRCKQLADLDMQEKCEAEYFLARGEECLRLADTNRQIANELQAISDRFMAKAVELDTNREKLLPKPEGRARKD